MKRTVVRLQSCTNGLRSTYSPRTEENAKAFLQRIGELGIELTAVFGGFEGESYADIPTVVRTVGLVPESTRSARTKEMKEIADFAKSECGLEFSEAEMDQCIDDNARGNLGEGELGQCRDGRGDVAEEWDCDEVYIYFQDDLGGTGGTDTGE